MPREATGKQAIRGALLELLGEKGFAEISISELVERAGVSRTTYYRHYYEQREVLEDVIGGVIARMRSLVDSLGVPNALFPEQDRHYGLVLYQMILVYRDSRDVLEPILRSDMRGLFSQRINAFILESFDEWLAPVADRDSKPVAASAGFIEHLKRYTSAGIIATLEEWIVGGCDESPDDILDFLLRVSGGNFYLMTGQAPEARGGPRTASP